MSFSKLSPKVSKRSNSHLARKQRSYIENLYHDSINYDEIVKTYTLPRIRPSSLPMCSIRIWEKMISIASRGYYEEKLEASSEFFCEVGTVAHEVFQKYMGTTGVIYGDWKCVNKKCKSSKSKRLTSKGTTNNRCPSCDNLMEYHEIEVFYNGIFAHIDCIIKLPESEGGGWWVLDYKTATKNKCAKLTSPLVPHTYQIPTYVYILRKVLNLDIVGYSLLYISRDNPFEYKSIEIEWTESEENRIRNILNIEKSKFLSALHDMRDMSIDRIIDTKPCSCINEYDSYDFYSTCSFLPVCFDKKKLRKELRKLQKQSPYTDKEAESLYTAIRKQGKPK